MREKHALRRQMRSKRREFVAALPEQVRGLVFSRPPQEIDDFFKSSQAIGFYYPMEDEAPALGWLRWFHESGKTVALPRIDPSSSTMHFHVWENPWAEDELETGPNGILQPSSGASAVSPEALVVPLLAFTDTGMRLGQGGGHYDRWLGANGPTKSIGLAWDCQMIEALPLEDHDQSLDAIVTPTRIIWSER